MSDALDNARRSIASGFLLEENAAMGKYEWLLYVGLAGLAWGTYVPIIFYGGNELSGKPGPSGRFMAILCVGAAYFVIGVLLPLLMFATGWLGAKWSDVNFGASGLTFASLAGVAGALGAIGVIFATTAAMGAAKAAGLPRYVQAVHRAADLRPGPGDQRSGEHLLAPAEGRSVALRPQERASAVVGGNRPRRRWGRSGALLEGSDGGELRRSRRPAATAARRHTPRRGFRARAFRPQPGDDAMTPEQAVERLGTVLAHAWMVRTFLKHADEIQEDADMLEVPRTIFDYVRATEPAAQRGDAKDFLHRIRGKLLPKTCARQAEYLSPRSIKRVSDHTNFLDGVVSRCRGACGRSRRFWPGLRRGTPPAGSSPPG